MLFADRNEPFVAVDLEQLPKIYFSGGPVHSPFLEMNFYGWSILYPIHKNN
jgi:hypothetical protein